MLNIALQIARRAYKEGSTKISIVIQSYMSVILSVDIGIL
jgi:hypothetical protein